MKQLYKISVIFTGALLLALASCTEEVLRDASPVQDGGIQAYISETNSASLLFLPDAPTSFTITIGRQNTQGRAEVPLTVNDVKGLLTLNDAVTFEDGQALAELEVDFSAMELGESTTLELAIKNADDRYLYGLSELNINVLRDYNWKDVGAANFYDGFWTGETVQLPIQQAEGTQLFRFKDLYSEIFLALDPSDPDIEACRGYNLQFYIDTVTYAAIALPVGVQDFGLGMYGYTFHWGAPYAQYCSFTNEGNVYTIGILYYNNGTPWNYGEYFTFTWTDGFGGEMVDPYKDETVVIEKLEKTLTQAEGYYLGFQQYSYYGTDEYGGRTTIYVDNYIVQLEGDGLELSLDILAFDGSETAIPAGTYTINKSDDGNSARPGTYAEVNAYETSSYAKLPAISPDLTLYLVSGTVTIDYNTDTSEYTITIDAVTGKGSTIQATYTGTLTITDLS
jgi:hypothetical protein